MSVIPKHELLKCLCVLLFFFQDFEEACFLLKKCGAVHISQQEVTVSGSGAEVLSFLQNLVQPFIDSYQVLFNSDLFILQVCWILK